MQQPKPGRAAQAAPDARAAAATPRVTAQRRLSDAINGGRAVAQLAALGSLINAGAAVVQRAGDDDDAGASASSSSGPIGSAAASPSTLAGIAPVQAPGAEAQRLLAAMAAMRGQAAAAPNHGAAAAAAAAGHGGAAPDRVSASASSDSMVLTSIAGPEMSGQAASAFMRGHAPPLLRGPAAPAAVAAAGAAAGGAAPPRHALANLLFSSLSPMARHSAERSLYFRDGTRIRLMHPEGPEISQEAMDRRAFVASPDGSFYSSSHYNVHDNREAITEPARMGAAGKIFEISDRHIHPSRGWPAREAGIRDEAHLGRVVAAAAQATQAIRDAKDRLAEAQALLDANPHEPKLIAARTRATNRLRMRIARGNLAIRIAYGGRRLDPRAPVLPAGNAAAGAGRDPGPGPGSGSGGAPAVVSGSSSSSAQRPNANASAAAGSSSGNSNVPAHAQPQPVPANAAAAAAAAAPAAAVDLATAAARDALVLIARAHMATIDARARPGPPASGGAGGKPPAA